MRFVVDVWPILAFLVMLTISLLAIISNGLRLLAMRKRYGLRKMLGTTSVLQVCCVSLMHFINGLVGIPLPAIDRILGENWPPPNSVWSVATTCTITSAPGIVLYNSALWYLLAIAFVRFLLVFWPHRAKRALESRATWIATCVVPFLMGVFPTAFGLVTKALQFGKFQNCCAPIPYEDSTPEGLMRLHIYQLISLVWSLVLPVPISLGLYLTMGIKLYLQQRAAKQQQERIGAGDARRRGNSAVHPMQPATRAQHDVTTTLRSDVGAAARRKQVKVVAAHQRKYDVVRMLACAYIVNIICISPVYVLWLTGFYYSVKLYSAGAMFAEAVNWLYLLAAPLDSTMYAVVSKDFRQVYKQIIFCH